MAVVETLDIVLGAKTQQADAELRKSISEVRNVKTEMDSLNTAMGGFEPITGSLMTSLAGVLTSIPGVSAAVQVFNATAAAIDAAFAARQVASVNRLEKAVEAVKKEAKAATTEVRYLDKAFEDVGNKADDIIDVDFRVINPNTPKLGSNGGGMIVRPNGSNAMRPFQVGQGRSLEEQRAYIRSIDESILKTATYKSTWTSAGTASRGAMALGTAGAAAAAAAVGVVVAGVAGMAYAWHNVSKEMVAIDAIADSAAKLGMSFRDLSTMRLSLAETSGLDESSIDNALQKMQVGLADAASKQSGPLFDKLAAAGLDAAELLKMGPAKAMEEIMAKTQDLQNPTDQLVLAYELFGKQGAALVSSLRDGPEALKDMAAWADRTGMNLSNAQAEQVGAANDAWGRLEMVATGAWRQIAAEAAPVLTVIYDNIAAGAVKFSDYLKYLPTIIDNTVYYAGVLSDVNELINVMHQTLFNIVTLNWDEVGKDIQSAFTFDTGQKNLEAVQKARADAAAEASRKEKSQTNGESQIAAYETQKQREQELAEAQREAVKARERAEQEHQKAIQKSEEAVRKKFDAVRQEIEIQKILGSMNAKQAEEREQEIRDRIALHAELREQGMFNFSNIDALVDESNRLKKQNEERIQLGQKADELNKQFNPGIQLRESMQQLNAMFERGLISEATYKKAAIEAGSKDMPEYKGAVSVQAGSVEAYKLLLDRENGARGDAIALRRATEEQLGVSRDMLTSLQSIKTVGRARS